MGIPETVGIVTFLVGYPILAAVVGFKLLEGPLKDSASWDEKRKREFLERFYFTLRTSGFFPY